MGNLWQAIRSWWENKKPVIEDLVLPQLNQAVQPLADLIASKGVDADKAKAIAAAVVGWIQDYLRRQL